MRDLEQRIKEWRDGLQVSPEFIEELEGHLRETIDAKLKEGKSHEEAFRLALAEMGSSDKVSAEYLKMERTTWWPVRAALWGTITLAGAIVYALSRDFNSTPNQDYPELLWLLTPHVVAVTFGYMLTYLLGGLGICFAAQRYFSELTPGQARSLRKAMLGFSWVAMVSTVAGVVLGMIWAQHAWGRLWAWDAKETGGAALVLWQIFFLMFQATRYATIERTAMLSLVGNMVVSAAWFGGSSILLLFTLVLLHVVIIPVFSARSSATALSKNGR